MRLLFVLSARWRPDESHRDAGSLPIRAMGSPAWSLVLLFSLDGCRWLLARRVVISRPQPPETSAEHARLDRDCALRSVCDKRRVRCCSGQMASSYVGNPLARVESSSDRRGSLVIPSCAIVDSSEGGYLAVVMSASQPSATPGSVSPQARAKCPRWSFRKPMEGLEPSARQGHAVPLCYRRVIRRTRLCL